MKSLIDFLFHHKTLICVASSFLSLVTYSYNTYSNEVGYGSPYGYSTSVTSQQNMGYDISADYVDSTTTYEPRSTIIDPDFIGGHSKYIFSILISLNTLSIKKHIQSRKIYLYDFYYYCYDSLITHI